MLESVPVCIAVGCALGLLAGLGVGGGSLLMLWLTVVLNVPHTEARMINLLFFIPTALISSFLRKKQGALSYKTILPAIISACLFGWLGTLVSNTLPVAILRKIFGVLLILTGVREICYRARNAR